MPFALKTKYHRKYLLYSSPTKRPQSLASKGENWLISIKRQANKGTESLQSGSSF